MEKKFNHYLSCRYNLNLFTENYYKVKDRDQWMKKRLPMFERLLDSLELQSSYNFTLIVGVDPNTPNEYVNEIYEAIDKYSFQSTIVNERPVVYIRDRIEHETEWVISSRIDNDDTYMPEFIKVIQDCFREQEELIDIKGLQNDGKDYYKLIRDKMNSPFISLIEKSKGCKTVGYKMHPQMPKYFKSRYASDQPLYVQHIHDTNAINKINGIKI